MDDDVTAGGAAPPPITLHSRRWTEVLWLVSAGAVIAVPVFGMAASSVTTVGVVVAAVGAVLVLGVLFDRPVRSVFDDAGILRVCRLRRQSLPWDQVDAIEPVRRSGPSRGGMRVPTIQAVPGEAPHDLDTKAEPNRGVLARRGRRRYLLVDGGIGREEFAALDAVVDAATDHTMLALREPPLAATPTTLRRRGVDGNVDRSGR